MVELARGIQLEQDLNYSNDSSNGANALHYSLRPGNQKAAAVAGNLMAPEGFNFAQDCFGLGRLTAGNRVELNLRLPEGSTVSPLVGLVERSGRWAAD